MQTPAEIHLIRTVAGYIDEKDPHECLQLNGGAGKSLVVEEPLVRIGLRFREDRVDLTDCEVLRPSARRRLQCPVQAMGPVPAGGYDAAILQLSLGARRGPGFGGRRDPSGPATGTIPDLERKFRARGLETLHGERVSGTSQIGRLRGRRPAGSHDLRRMRVQD